MRKLIAWNVMTLDGYFEGDEPFSLDFHTLVWGPELEALSIQQLQEAGLLLFGRKTYEGMAAYWTSAEDEPVTGPMNTLPKAVISNTLTSADWNNTRLLKGDGVELVRGLKAEEGGTIYVFGSAELLAGLLAAGLVDEYRLGIAPILRGGGNKLFKPCVAQIGMELIQSRALAKGGMLLFYRPSNAA